MKQRILEPLCVKIDKKGKKKADSDDDDDEEEEEVVVAKPAAKNSKKKGKQRVDSDEDEPVRGKKAGQLICMMISHTKKYSLNWFIWFFHFELISLLLKQILTVVFVS